MISHYITIGLRAIRKDAVYSSLNIAGLAIGLTAFILIFLWVKSELSYDRFNDRAHQLYRVVENQYYANNEVFPVAVTPGPLGPHLKETFPDVVSATHLMPITFMLQSNELAFYHSGMMVHPVFLDMFSYTFAKGSAKKALSKVEDLVITESLAKKYFGNEDPIGKVFRIHNNDFTVSAVLHDVPEMSHLKFDYLVHYDAYKRFGWTFPQNWNSNNGYTYVMLRPETDHEAMTGKIRGVLQKQNVTYKVDLFLQPLTSIHLHSNFTADVSGHGDIQYVYIFSFAGIFILLIACINFMNLSTAKSAQRSKEVGMRKAIGAQRSQLIRQFLFESIVLSFIALGIALVLVETLLPAFNLVSGKQLEFHPASSVVLLTLPAVTLMTGIIAGSYPAFFLSGFNTVSVLKGTSKTGRGAVMFRKILVTAQFCISILLITGTIVVFDQLNFIRSKKLGFEKQNVVGFTPLPDREKFKDFKEALLATGGVSAVTISSNNLTYVASSGADFEWEGKTSDKKVLLHTLAVDPDFVETFQIKMVEGRDFSSDIASDGSAVILNEEAIRQMGIEDPVNKRWGEKGKIIGVIKDFHFKSVHEKIEPLVIFNDIGYGKIYARLNGPNAQESIAAIERTFSKFAPDHPFEYSFLDDDFDHLYTAEQRTGRLFNYFACIAIFVSCLGLFGLVMFATEQRTKEIGVRKVLGASVSSVVTLISVDFIKLVLMANIITIPVSLYAMNRWLSGFAYHVDIHWTTFAIAGVTSVGIALITMAYQSLKAAWTNPVKALRAE
ncbi:ABC transporter permease [Dawidia soli]|uniref:ABC transporter permease n=1 Tax=Dawidia soli TaxID=2782352 RepID=A0AAP2GJW9_9BACT|nr:ABC transporter permease [Dawidia soli]MBT1689826.1 ABC transporter permease [Dawidia soli]